MVTGFTIDYVSHHATNSHLDESHYWHVDAIKPEPDVDIG